MLGYGFAVVPSSMGTRAYEQDSLPKFAKAGLRCCADIMPHRAMLVVAASAEGIPCAKRREGNAGCRARGRAGDGDNPPQCGYYAPSGNTNDSSIGAWDIYVRVPSRVEWYLRRGLEFLWRHRVRGHADCRDNPPLFRYYAPSTGNEESGNSIGV